jgi:hypothetical protein
MPHLITIIKYARYIVKYILAFTDEFLYTFKMQILSPVARPSGRQKEKGPRINANERE